MLEDIAILTGGQVISEERGFTMENASIELLGKAEKVVIDKDNTTIVNGAGDDAQIKARVNQINLGQSYFIQVKEICFYFG